MKMLAPTFFLSPTFFVLVGIFFVSAFGLASASATNASTNSTVSISEVAWMGTAVSASDEWMELANTGNEAADISGWTLGTEDGGITIALSGSIPAGGFFLLERTDDDTVSGIAADAIYTGSLSNDGEVLVLKDATGNIVERMDMSSGWGAGNNETKETMQKVNGAWAAGAPTPKANNAGVPPESGASANSANSSSGSSAGSSSSGTNGSNSGASSSGSSSSSSSNSGTKNSESSSHSNPDPLSEITKEKITLRASAGRDRVLPAGGEAIFAGRAENGAGEEIPDAVFKWSWGDGTKGEGKHLSHIYKYAGNYTVVLNAAFPSIGKTAVSRASVKVFEPSLALSLGVAAGVPVITLANNSPHEINLGNFALRANEREFRFPADTILAAKETLTLDEAITGLPLPVLTSLPTSTSPASLALIFPSGKSIVVHPPLSSSRISAIQETLARTQAQVLVLQEKILQTPASSSRPFLPIFSPLPYNTLAPKSPTTSTSTSTGTGTETTHEVSSVILLEETPKEEPKEIVEITKPKSALSRMLDFFFR